MAAPDIASSTREQRLEFVKHHFRCRANCEICGNCNILRGHSAEDVYADYIDGLRSFVEVSISFRNG